MIRTLVDLRGNIGEQRVLEATLIESQAHLSANAGEVIAVYLSEESESVSRCR